MFKIKKLNLYNFEGDVYTYYFSCGVNYIRGGNSTGKTEFYKFMDYMLGSSENIFQNPWFKGTMKCATLEIDKDGLLTGKTINKGTRKRQNISLETYVINRKELLEIMKKAHKISAFYDLKDILGYLCDEKQIHTYEYKGYARCLDSTEAYFKYSLEMLDIDISSRVFKSNWPIYTNTNDTPPTKYLANANVKKSFVANGAVIDGTVENSILGREVTIGKGAVIKNCVIFSGSKIASGAVLENVIIDKRAKVEKKLELKGTETSPLYIKEGDRV